MGLLLFQTKILMKDCMNEVSLIKTGNNSENRYESLVY